MKKSFFILSALVLVLMSCSKSQATEQNEAEEKISVEESLTESESAPASVSGSTVESEDEYGTPGNRTFAYIRKLASKEKYEKAVENLTQDYLRGRWSVEVISEEMNIICIAFDDDGTYYWYSPFGGYMGERGKYTLDGNTVTMFYPNDTMSQWEALVFPNGKETTLVYDSGFKDFYCVGVLRNERLILRNWVEETPVGEKCVLKGIDVIKTDEKSVVAKDNLKLRYEPSQKGREGRFWYPMFLRMCLQDELEDSYYAVESSSETINVILKGTRTTYTARTVREDTIDGITSPWYRICLFDCDGESIAQYFWVFGGYLEDYDEKKLSEYNKSLMNAAIEKKILVIDEDAYRDHLMEESVKRVTPIASKSAEIIHKAGNVAESDDKLEGTIFKIGMTRKEITDLLGDPVQAWDDVSKYWVDFLNILPKAEENSPNAIRYWIDHGGSGFRLMFYFDGDRLKRIETEWEK